jgi:hypothetical protein
MQKRTVTLTFIEELLGTATANPEIFEEFIASKGEHPDEEVAALPDVEEEVAKTTTVFSRLDDRPILWDYQIKGFFKDAAGMLRRVAGTKSKKLTAYKKVIDGLVFVEPRQIPLNFDGEIGYCSRPLRAQTAQGERVALARSETIPAGATITFDITVLDEKLIDLIDEWLDYGKLRGLGQWRNSGKGKFDWSDAE